MHAMKKAMLAVGAALLLGVAAPAWALAGNLSAPGVAFSASYPEAARNQVTAVLNRKDCTFVDGHFVNWWTSLRYRGETGAVNQFVGELAACPGVTVSMRLKKLPGDCDWRVGHDAGTNRFQVEVNLASSRLDLEKLVFPPVQGPPVPSIVPAILPPAGSNARVEEAAAIDRTPAGLARRLLDEARPVHHTHGPDSSFLQKETFYHRGDPQKLNRLLARLAALDVMVHLNLQEGRGRLETPRAEFDWSTELGEPLGSAAGKYPPWMVVTLFIGGAVPLDRLEVPPVVHLTLRRDRDEPVRLDPRIEAFLKERAR